MLLKQELQNYIGFLTLSITSYIFPQDMKIRNQKFYNLLFNVTGSGNRMTDSYFSIDKRSLRVSALSIVVLQI